MLILLIGLLLIFGNLELALATPLEDLVAAAKKEGVIELLAPSTTGEKGAQALAGAFNKKYSLNIKINYTPSSNMTEDVAKLVMGAASRATPEWDLMLEAQELWRKFNGQTSAFIPGTSAYKYAQGKRLLQMTQNQAQTVDRLARQYGKILGFER